jgi:uncharacterized membrane protein
MPAEETMAELGALIGTIVLFAVVLALAVPILLIWLVVTVIRNISAPPRPRRDPAVEELRYRLARGEISEPEFEQAMYALGYEKVDR